MDGPGGMTRTRARIARRLRHYLSRLFQFNSYRPMSSLFWRRHPACRHRQLLSSCSALVGYSQVCPSSASLIPSWMIDALPRLERCLSFASAVWPEVTVCWGCCSNLISRLPLCHLSEGTSRPPPSPCSSSLTYLSGRR